MKKKVAAYCRVSTKEELQQYSLESQKEYYKELIESNPDFIFVGIYSDTASGLKKKDRVQFEKMIKDCRRKKKTDYHPYIPICGNHRILFG